MPALCSTAISIKWAFAAFQLDLLVCGVADILDRLLGVSKVIADAHWMNILNLRYKLLTECRTFPHRVPATIL